MERGVTFLNEISFLEKDFIVLNQAESSLAMDEKRVCR